MSFDNKPKLYLILIMYAFLSWMIWLNRKGILGLGVFGSLLIMYAISAHTALNVSVITFMGHGFELVVATVFLYRAFSGSMVHEGERPFYAFCGFYLVIADFRFALNLLCNPEFQLRYHNHPAGHINDFIKIAHTFSVPLAVVTTFFLCLCLLPPIISFLGHRYRNWW